MDAAHYLIQPHVAAGRATRVAVLDDEVPTALALPALVALGRLMGAAVASHPVADGENRRRNLNCELYRNRGLVVPKVRFDREKYHSYADVIVVSEETGNVSFVRQGELRHISNMNELKLLLDAAFTGGEEPVGKKEKD